MFLKAGRRLFVWTLVAAFLCLFASAASAQAVADPARAEFNPSPDHSAVDSTGTSIVSSYILNFFVAGATQPTLTLNLGKPNPDPDLKIRFDFSTMVAALRGTGLTYEARVSAAGPGGVAASAISNQFTFTSPCSPTISPSTQSMTSAAGTGTVTVTAGTGCTWTAVSNATTWLSVSSGATGSGNATVGFSAAANTSASLRSGTITIAGQTFTVSQSGTSCAYSISPASQTVAAGGGTGTITVTTTATCAWTATTSGASWITVSNGTGRSGNGNVTFTAAANTSTTSRTGSIVAAGKTFTVTQAAGASPTIAVSPASLNIGLGTNALTTSAQQVIISQSPGNPVSWTIAASQPWLQVTPSSGAGTASVAVSLTAGATLPQSGTTATLTVTAAGSTNTVQVTLSVLGASVGPFGVIETPLDNTGGVTGSIAMTGWALDDIDVARVRVTRDPVAGEPQGTQIFIGTAVLVEGARPDVALSYPTMPHNTRGGWGLLVLTNMLPNLGNGTFRLNAYADDVDGHTTYLGGRTITCTNSTATTPFGAIDTPAQGETISGTSYNNFGWVLAPGLRRADPPGGGSVNVIIDGVVVGAPGGWTSRADLTAIFPSASYSGVNTAAGAYTFNSATLANGTHTIAWVLTDNLGGSAGVGSRYFNVLNGSGLSAGVTSGQFANDDDASGRTAAQVIAGPDAVSGASASALAQVAAGLVSDGGPIAARRGFSFDSRFRRLRPGPDGRVAVQAEEMDRIELRLSDGPATCAGYSTAGGTNAPLPVGSSLDPTSCVFTWQPGVGFVGSYEFVFVRQPQAGVAVREDVRIVLNPKRSGLVGPQVVIDIPGAQQVVGRSFLVAGWAADLDADVNTGIDALHVWAYPVSGEAPLFLGTATYGGNRPDVSAIYGHQFGPSGYGLEVPDLPAGTYDVAVFAWSTVTGGFVPATTKRLTVR